MIKITPNLNLIDGRGTLNVFDRLPFDVKRFFTIEAPKGQVRGEHAHHETEMILYAISGIIQIESIRKENTQTEILKPNSFGLRLNPDEFRKMTFLEHSILLVLASTNFDQNDYIFEVLK